MANYSTRLKLTENFVYENLINKNIDQKNVEKFVENEEEQVEDEGEEEDEIISEDLKIEEINTNILSARLNKFLNDNNISLIYNNLFKEYFGLSGFNFNQFCNYPKKWSNYHKKTQKRLKTIHNFLNNKEKQNEFLIKHQKSSNSIDTKFLSKKLSQFLTDNNISKSLFNHEISKMNTRGLYLFLRQPKEISHYNQETCKKLESIDNFFKNEENPRNFLKKFANKMKVNDINVNKTQLKELSCSFVENNYPEIEHIEYLSNKLELSVGTISDWFVSMRNIESKSNDNNDDCKSNSEWIIEIDCD